MIFFDGVLNSADYDYPSAGCIAVIFGNNLTDVTSVLGTSIGPDGNVVTTLADTSVPVNNVSRTDVLRDTHPSGDPDPPWISGSSPKSVIGFEVL